VTVVMAGERDRGEFAEATCTAPPERTIRFAAIALRHIPDDRPISVLDVGCGTGGLVFEIARTRPDAAVVGIDISAPNIRAAEARRRRDAAEGRTRFVHADYLRERMSPVDAIVTDGVLHLIGGESSTLFQKLADDLAPRGVLVCAMPYACAYNRVFAIVRRGLRAVRRPPLDRAILAAARALHGRDMSVEQLRERVKYMYMPPTRVIDRQLIESVAPAAGLRLVAEYPMDATSASQLRHKVIVFERNVSAAR
jgi:SAM-dependent methyltransferase